jgi:adenosine deaminase
MTSSSTRPYSHFISLCIALCTASAFAQAPAVSATERAFAAARKAGAPALYAFLKPFPKGADLHMHLSGAIYAETFLREAAQQNLCVDPAKLAFTKNTGITKSIPAQAICPDGAISATNAIQDQQLYDKLINSFSLRSFVPYAGFSGHDQFFTTFDRFRGLNDVAGEWLDEVATRAAAQNEQYLEIMQTPSFTNAANIGYKLGWPADFNDANHMTVLAKLRDALLAGGLRDDVSIDTKELADALDSRMKLEPNELFSLGDCKTLLPTGKLHPIDCPPGRAHVKIHFLYQVLRGFAPQQVFAQTLLGFELASAYPEQVVGINFVRAEDRRDAMAEYHTEMLMLDYLHSVYPKVHISLHAGELAPGLVPPDGLSFHIREAVELGHAERIGHGVDILHEDNPAGLLKEMAAKHIDVEINLISNEGILGITGANHPLATYRAAHVPFSLSTDDEGVSRTDLTHNYVQAVLDQNLTYVDLKQSARASLEHSFLPGPSLYLHPDDFTHRQAVCAAPITAKSFPPGPCKSFLATSERATQQYELERRFLAFEAASH